MALPAVVEVSRPCCGKVWYDDQRKVNRQIFDGDDTIGYAFMGQDPKAADNRWLREAFENQIPIIYFLGFAPGRYQAILPTFISGWDAAAFALSGLPEPLLLDAAHIVADNDERFGQPVVPNDIPLSKIHHAAFDAHLIGIDAAYRLHVSERLLGQNDGPMLEALKRLHGGTIHRPNRAKDLPDRNKLALRFERFMAAT
jgi:putative restriction endonuclease